MKVCSEKTQRYSQQMRRNLQKTPTFESWCHCGQLRAERKNKINEWNSPWLCLFAVYLRYHGTNMTVAEAVEWPVRTCVDEFRWWQIQPRLRAECCWLWGEKIKSNIQTQKKNTETLSASSDWLINHQLCIGGYVVDYYPVKAAVTETQQGVIKILHGLKWSWIILHLTAHGLLCFVGSKDVANWNRTLVELHTHPRVNAKYHYIKHISN